MSLAAIDAASRAASSATAPTVGLDATPTFALHWLIPRLADFRIRHPEIALKLSTSLGPIQTSSSVNWAIRRDTEHFKGMQAEAFLGERSILVAAPSLLNLAGLRTLDDLARFQLITIRARQDLWPLWLAASGTTAGRLTNWLTLDQTIFAIQAALAGLGVAVLPELFVTELLNRGLLVCPFGRQPVLTGSYHLVTLDHSENIAAKAFKDWLRQEAANDPLATPLAAA